LTVWTRILATRVLFDGTRAVWVVYLKDGSREQQQVQAKKEVILSGGSINSPQILMLSGVGPAEQLQKFGIDVVADLPGVTAAQTGSRDQGSPIILCRTRLRRRVRLRAMYVMKDIEGYLEYMMSPIHRKSDEIGLPLVEKFVSMDITDDEDPAIGDKIQEIHRNRFENDPALVDLVQNLSSYEGSGTSTK
jgi:hypothetical protein